jgi:hypothetical protein
MANRTAVPTAYAERPTERQLQYLRGLWVEKRVDKLSKEQFDWLDGQFNKPTDEQFLGVTVKRASDVISELVKLDTRDDIVRRQNPEAADVPAGRYAVENDEGELRFYRLWIGKTGYMKLYVLHGPDSSEIPYPAMVAILKKIEKAGIEACAIRYGQEIGACSNCGRRLTNRISRELGIGPVCGGRMFGDEFSDKVRVARNVITERGEDPDEVIDE